ncbi:MAG: ABC transporter permease [Spirochaetales bacterium]|jgi:peptide/nickel transport system permease protein|nr:ABC transporter permease [Spirochaetales bacterium]
MKTKKKDLTAAETYYMATQWQLMRRKFLKHKLARFSGVLLILLYTGGLFCGFVSPYYKLSRHDKLYMAPQKIHWKDETGFHLFKPFVYGSEKALDEETYTWVYVEDTEKKYPVGFFVRGDAYKFWGLFRTDVHLFGVNLTGTDGLGTLHLLGTDNLGRDVLSRIIYASRISLSIGLIGVFLSFILGVSLGGLAGYFGGRVDMAISRVIEFLQSLPTIPLWMAMAAALPPHWSSIAVYAGITVILSIVGWTGLARVVRGKFLELREEDFIMAAKASGAGTFTIIRRHMVPSFLSYLIVSLTLSIPGMILGETGLSYLGLGLRAPIVSWGTLLQQAQNFSVVALYPWLMIPALFVILAVLAFNFLGDGLRDAADPYK